MSQIYKSGLENFFDDNEYKMLQGKKIGLVTNHTGLTNNNLENNIDLFVKHNINIKALFAPEHGVRGNTQAGKKIESSIDPYTGIPVYSLYGQDEKPTIDMLKNIDVLIFDIQDVGVRFYTYLSTMFYCLEASKQNNNSFIILDRFNPLGRRIEGNLVEKEFSSFVGLYPIPYRHGMTFGELALWANEELNIGADLKVIELKGWKGQFFNEIESFWIPPSPNIPHFNTAVIYPITCLLEGTNISEGRGTTTPFEYFGASWIKDPYYLANHLSAKKLKGVKFRPVYFEPFFSKYKNQKVAGIHIIIEKKEEVNSLLTGLTIIKTIKELYSDNFKWKNNNNDYFFDLLMGTNKVRKKLNKGEDPTSIISQWGKEQEQFLEKRKNYLLY